MLEFLWSCMVLSFKSGLGAILWSVAVAVFAGVIGLIGMAIAKIVE